MVLLRRLICLSSCVVGVRGWTLDVGQRIAPRFHLSLGEDVKSASIGVVTQRPSLLDLPAVENWATKRGLKPFHVKKVRDETMVFI